MKIIAGPDHRRPVQFYMREVYCGGNGEGGDRDKGREEKRGRGLESAVCLDVDVGILHTDICGVSAGSECWTPALLPQWEMD